MFRWIFGELSTLDFGAPIRSHGNENHWWLSKTLLLLVVSSVMMTGCVIRMGQDVCKLGTTLSGCLCTHLYSSLYINKNITSPRWHRFHASSPSMITKHIDKLSLERPSSQYGCVGCPVLAHHFSIPMRYLMHLRGHSPIPMLRPGCEAGRSPLTASMSMC
jgi:hypothetical protein